jgi:di/tricarboxylate transporter
MKRLLFVVFVMALLSLPTFAQNQTGTMITLSWVPSISPFSGSHVYRANGACPVSGAPTGLVQVGIISGVTAGYDDKAGTPGNKYCYTVRAFDSFGTESGDSNAAGATFPFPQGPQAHTGLVATPK